MKMKNEDLKFFLPENRQNGTTLFSFRTASFETKFKKNIKQRCQDALFEGDLILRLINFV